MYYLYFHYHASRKVEAVQQHNVVMYSWRPLFIYLFIY